MRLPELIALLCQAWLLSSRAALIERRGRVIVGLAQHIVGRRAMSLSQSGASGDGSDVLFGQIIRRCLLDLRIARRRASSRALAMSQKCELRTRAVQQKLAYSITSLRVLSFIAH